MIELLVVMAIIGVLLAISLTAILMAIPRANCLRCASNMRSLAIAFNAYAMDNSGNLPGRIPTGGGDKWPLLLYPYVGNNPYVYIDPADPVAAKIPVQNIVVNSPNNSSYIFNVFNDLGAFANPQITVNMNTISGSSLCILGVQNPGGNNFYLDLQEGDQNTVLKKTAYLGGSNYAFADQSVQFISLANYTDTIWEVNQSYAIPAQ